MQSHKSLLEVVVEDLWWRNRVSAPALLISFNCAGKGLGQCLAVQGKRNCECINVLSVVCYHMHMSTWIAMIS